MVRRKRSRPFRLVAKVTAAMLCTSMLSAVTPPRSAEAQAKITRAVILDFQVAKDLDASLGRRAADAVALDLTNSGNYEVLSRQELQDAMVKVFGRVDMDLSPADQLRLVRVGELDARYVISGKVFSKSVVTSPPAATVRIGVLRRDTDSGDPDSGAMVDGEASRPAGDADPEVLVDEAISTAADRATRQMEAYFVPAGHVLIVARDQRIVINRGENHGVRPGMRFSVTQTYRDVDKEQIKTDKVGELTVDTVDPEQATCHTSLSLKGIQTMNRVHAIYEWPPMPSVGGTSITNRPPMQARTGMWQKVAKPLLAIVGLSSLISLGGGDRGKVTSAPKRTSAQTGAQNTTVVVTFQDPSDIPKSNILAYLVFRSTSPSFIPDASTFIDVVGGSESRYLDTASIYDVDADISIDQDTGTIDTFTVDKQVITTPPTTPAAVGLPALGQNVAQDFTITTVHPALVAGVPFYYSIARLTKAVPAVQPALDTGGGGGGGGGGQQTAQGYTLYVSSPSSVAGPATPLSAPTLVSPPNAPAAGSDTVNLGTITFEWLASAGTGTNEYVIQVSDDARFPASRLWQSSVNEGITIQTGAAVGTQLARTFTSVDNFFVALGNTKGPFFWRVGVRSLLDVTAPAGGYLFNASPFSFTTLDAPPNPPSTTRQFRAPRSFIQKPGSAARPAQPQPKE
ncbi:MAG: hypothetical protein GW880_15645 [Armatimonadetes bacterium]|nr:hypothetical protein [Armatimonadota bacterium]NCP29109.1 hypothetical protein [Armatimonadota bacterium]